MKKIIIGKNDAGQRLDKFLAKAFPALPGSLMQRAIRRKRVKKNGQRSHHTDFLCEGDVLDLYINDEWLETTKKTQKNARLSEPGTGTMDFSVVYEDEHLLIVNKPEGLPVHAHSGSGDDLVAQILRYLICTGGYDPMAEQSFTPAVANRLDKNTEGLVIAVKTAPAARFINEKIRLHEIEKKYLAITHGIFSEPAGSIRTFLAKDTANNMVRLSAHPAPGAKEAITHYRILQQAGDLSLVECVLETGRTHQIRTHLAHVGHPILGDQKYGNPQKNKSFPHRNQALCAWKLRFCFADCPPEFQYLRGMEFTVDPDDFKRRYNAFFSGEKKCRKND